MIGLFALFYIILCIGEYIVGDGKVPAWNAAVWCIIVLLYWNKDKDLL